MDARFVVSVFLHGFQNSHSLYCRLALSLRAARGIHASQEAQP